MDSKDRNASSDVKLGIIFDTLTGFSNHQEWTAEDMVKRIRKHVISGFCENALSDTKEMDAQEIEWYLKTQVI